MKHIIRFIWFRDSKGYTLLPEAPRNKKGNAGKVSGTLERIQGNGGELIPYLPLEENHSLFREFADIKKTSDGVLKFIQKYGRLGHFGAYDTVEDVLQFAENINIVLKNKNKTIDVQFGWIEPKLSFDLTGKPSLVLTPKNLQSALWLQLGEAMANGRTSGTICLCCNEWFETGPGTGRRLNAKFCSDEHRIAYNSRQRQSTKAKVKTKRRK